MGTRSRPGRYSFGNDNQEPRPTFEAADLSWRCAWSKEGLHSVGASRTCNGHTSRRTGGHSNYRGERSLSSNATHFARVAFASRNLMKAIHSYSVTCFFAK